MIMLTLKAEKRDTKIRPFLVRKKGEIPAVFYGRKEASTPIMVSSLDFLKAWKEAGESTIISLSYDNKDLPALIYDVAVDPIRGEPIHVDFYVTEADKAVEVDVPIVFKGESSAVKELGGSLVKVLHAIPISGLPKDLPHEIVVDVSSLKTFESRILVKDLLIPEGVVAQLSLEDIVASVAEPKQEEVEEVKEFDASAIEVEKKGKQEEALADTEIEEPPKGKQTKKE